jgi:plasmid maintenance system killer protein
MAKKKTSAKGKKKGGASGDSALREEELRKKREEDLRQLLKERHGIEEKNGKLNSLKIQNQWRTIMRTGESSGLPCSRLLSGEGQRRLATGAGPLQPLSASQRFPRDLKDTSARPQAERRTTILQQAQHDTSFAYGCQTEQHENHLRERDTAYEIWQPLKAEVFTNKYQYRPSLSEASKASCVVAFRPGTAEKTYYFET